MGRLLAGRVFWGEMSTWSQAAACVSLEIRGAVWDEGHC